MKPSLSFKDSKAKGYHADTKDLQSIKKTAPVVEVVEQA